MLIRKSRNMYIDLVCSYIVEQISTDARYWHTTGLGYLMRDERQFVPCLVECWKWQKKYIPCCSQTRASILLTDIEVS